MEIATTKEPNAAMRGRSFRMRPPDTRDDEPFNTTRPTCATCSPSPCGRGLGGGVALQRLSATLRRTWSTSHPPPRPSPARGGGSSLQPVAVRLAHFPHFRQRTGADVTLVGVIGDVILVVILGRVKLRQRLERRYDRIIHDFRIVELLDVAFGDLLLVLARIENRRPILMADIVALAVLSRGIVRGEEDLQELAVGDDARIVSNFDGLGVIGAAAADGFVVRGFL